jgi:hypothetical protein
MAFTIQLGWWVAPAFVTVALFVGWAIWGIKMDGKSGGMFPDFWGAFLQLGGYLIAALLSSFAWLAWAILR